MNWDSIKKNIECTPAFVFDQNNIVSNLIQFDELKMSGCQVLYSVKALPFKFVLSLAKDYLNGFSVSSLYEARFAKEILGETGAIHITTPGLRDEEFNELTGLCSHISFNSETQFHRLRVKDPSQCSLGVRINPKLSYVNDLRFDPCRPHSKLGIDIESLQQSSIIDAIEGIHFHTVFSYKNYLPLLKNIDLIKKTLGNDLAKLNWINLGGGYLHNQIIDQQPLINCIKNLITEFDLEVFIEPGKAVVGNTGYLVSTVIDLFSSDGKKIAVLDTSVNHNPEVFEYQIKPQILEQSKNGNFSYLLVGSSCLAGDLFGEYQFASQLKVGDKLVFTHVGAYSLTKANRFNGYNLPAIYIIDSQNNLKLVQQYSYQNFREQWF